MLRPKWSCGRNSSGSSLRRIRWRRTSSHWRAPSAFRPARCFGQRRAAVAPLQPSLDDLLKQAFEHRADYRAAQANVRAADFALQSAHSEHWPEVVVQGDYGDIGTRW